MQAREFIDAIQRGDEKEAQRLEKILDAPRPTPPLGSVALWYAEAAGWPVFPLRVGEKIPATKHGFKDATRDPDQIRQWWERGNPNYNIGIPTGPDTFDVVDVDGPDGFQSLVELQDALPDVHGKVDTPRGLHLYVEGTTDGNRAGVRKGIDYRSAGGFVVAPPSMVDGKRYSWVMQPSPRILEKAT